MQRLRSARFRQTTLLFWVCVAFLVGVGLAKTGILMTVAWPLALLAVAVPLLRRKNLMTLAVVMAVALCFGWWRGSVYMQHLATFDDYFGSKVTLIATAGEDATYDRHKQLTFDVHNPLIVETGQRLTGKVGLSGFGVPAVFASDTVQVTGKLYPSRGSYQAKMSYGQMVIVSRGDSLIADLRRKFAAGMQTALPEPLASFGMGLLIGQRANLPDEVYQSLLMVGLVHIIAVSGYNLTIILRASKGLLSRYSRRLSLVLALVLIGLFLLFAGASASIVRAAIVSLLSIGAAYYGRSVKPLVLILLAAAITGWANPYYVWSDVSWYLSFLAFFGVMILAPMLLLRFPARLQISLVFTVALESLCAEIMTLPYVLHIFGQMSFVSILANVLVVGLVPLAMLLCMVAGLAGMLVPAIAGWFAWPAKIVLSYMLDIADILSRIPHIFVQGLQFSLSELLLVYVVVGAVSWHLWRKLSRKQLEQIAERSIGSLPKQG